MIEKICWIGAFKLLKENNNDTTVLEGYAEKSKEPLKFEDFILTR